MTLKDQLVKIANDKTTTDKTKILKAAILVAPKYSKYNPIILKAAGHDLLFLRKSPSGRWTHHWIKGIHAIMNVKQMREAMRNSKAKSQKAKKK
jgi:hypothetical protein